jgi:hypothetical protein
MHNIYLVTCHVLFVVCSFIVVVVIIFVTAAAGVGILAF